MSFWDRQGAITSYAKRCPSRGRPRRMLHLSEAVHQEARSLVASWQGWLKERTLNPSSGAGLVSGRNATTSLATEDQRLADELQAERSQLNPAPSA